MGKAETVGVPRPRQQSDDELLERDFVARDPEQLPDLSRSLPANWQDAEIESWYDVTPPKGVKKPYVWCAHDGKATHWRGYVMITPDGMRFLLGRDCGLDQFGHNFEEISKHFDSLFRRRSYLFALRAIRAELPVVITQVRKLLSHPSLTEFEQLQSLIKSEARDLYNAVRYVAEQRNGALVVHEQVRDYAAELKRDEKQGGSKEDFAELEQQRKARTITVTEYKYRRNELLDQKDMRDDTPIYREIERQIGQLAGYQFLVTGDSSRDVLDGQEQIMQRMLAESAMRSDDMSIENMRRIVATLRECCKNIEEQCALLRAPIQFFETPNLDTLTRWIIARKSCRTSYRRSGRALVRESESNDEIQIGLSRDYSPPTVETISALKQTLSLDSLDTPLARLA